MGKAHFRLLIGATVLVAALSPAESSWADEPATKPCAGQPASQPATQPCPSQPATKPCAGQPASQPATQPCPSQPATKPCPCQPAPKPRGWLERAGDWIWGPVPTSRPTMTPEQLKKMDEIYRRYEEESSRGRIKF